MTCILLIGLLPLVIGCGSGEDKVVAKVGDKSITVSDLKKAWTKLPRSEAMTKKQALLMLINKELLILEARKAGLDRDERIARELERIKSAKIPEEFNRIMAAQVSVSEEEVRRYFEESGMESYTEVRVSHIVVRTREEAEEILEKLKGGADFAQLAKERSLDKDTAERGGDLGYWEQGVHFGTFVQKVFPMKVGEVSAPLQDPRGMYRIFKKCEERPIGFEKQKPRIKSLLERRKLKQKREEYLEQLRKQFELNINAETLHLLLEKDKEAMNSLPELSAEDQSRTLFSYEGGEVTLRQYLEQVRRLRPHQRPAAGDSAQVVKFIEWIAATLFLLPEAFHKAGIDRTEEMQSYLTKKKEALMVAELRRREVEEKVLTEEAIRAYYEEHLNDYFGEETIIVESLLAEDKQKAQCLLEEIRKGADMEDLARQYPFFFPGQRENYAVFSLHPSDKKTGRLRHLVEEAEAAGVGELRGPIEFPVVGKSLTSYLVFRVLQREAAKQRFLSDPEVRASVEAALRSEKAQEIEGLFEKFLLQLREKHADQITIYQSNLEMASVG